MLDVRYRPLSLGRRAEGSELRPAPLWTEIDPRFGRRYRNPGEGWTRFRNPSGFVAVYRRYPATITVLAPYVLLVLPPALLFGNPRIWFLIGVAGIAIAGAFLWERFQPKPKEPTAPTNNVAEYGRGLFYLAVFAIMVGSIVSAAAAAAGKGSVAAQIAQTDSSGLIGTIDSLTKGWVVVGAGMLFAAHVGGQCTRKAVLLILVVPVLAEAFGVFFTQPTAPLFELVTFLVMMSLLLGLIRPRVLLIGMLATLLLWPVVFELRNQLRLAGGVPVSSTVTAFDRLRFDLQYAEAADLEVPLQVNVPGFLQHPTAVDVLRYGIVPRVLDPDRELVSTGQVINVAMGGPVTSAYTFGPVTTAYVLEGPVYLFLYYLLLAVFLSVIWRWGTRITPVRMVVVALVISGPLGWFSTFPDTIIGSLQRLVSAVPLLVALFLLRDRPAPVRDTGTVRTGDHRLGNGRSRVAGGRRHSVRLPVPAAGSVPQRG